MDKPLGGRTIALLSALAIVGIVGCGNSGRSVAELAPVREVTRGDSIWAAAPAGADLVLEVDLQRLRKNTVFGPLLKNLTAPDSLRGTNLLQSADVALLCIYDIGDNPKQLVILQAKQRLAEARALREGLFAVGDKELLARAEALPASGRSMAEDSALLNLRAQAMPKNATHAAIRLVARLDFDARVSIAAEVEVSEVPVSIALWGDVIDDLAIVVDLTTEDSSSLPKLARAISGLKKRLSRQTYIRYLGLSSALQGARVVRVRDSLRVIFVVGPKGLARALERIQKQLLRQNENGNENEKL